MSAADDNLAIPVAGPVPSVGPGRLAIVTGVVVTLSAAIYGLSLWGQMGHWDDAIYVTENQYLLNPSWKNTWALASRPYFNHWYPLTMLTYVADFAVWGVDPVGYHLTSLVFHIVAGVLVYFVARRLSGDDSIGLLTAALFTAAPTAVESVAWVSERKNVVCLVLWLAGYLMYLRSASCRTNQALYWGAVLMSVLACMAKAQGVTLVAVVGLTELFIRRPQQIAAELKSLRHMPASVEGSWLSRIPQLKSAILHTIPFAVVAVGFTVLNMMTATSSMIARHHGGSFTATMMTNVKVLISYVRMMVVPVGLSPVYQVEPWVPSSAVDWLKAAGGLVVLGCMVWVTVKVVRRKALVLFLWGWFLVNLLPVLNIVAIPWLKQDRYLYFPSVGLLLLLVLFVREGARRVLSSDVWRPAFRVAAVLIVASHVALSAYWASQWSAPVSLWAIHAVNEAPDTVYSHYGAGDAIRHSGRFDLAVVSYERAVECVDESKGGKDILKSRLFSNIGRCKLFSGDMAGGLDYVRRSEALAPRDSLTVPHVADCFFRAALASKDARKRVEYATKAAETYDKIAEIFDMSPASAIHRIQSYQLLGRREQALQMIDSFIASHPGNPGALQLRGSILDDLGRLDDAVRAYEGCVRLDPLSPVSYYNLGFARQMLGDYGAAEAYYSRAYGLAPGLRREARPLGRL